jgi:hypothetical protein
MLCDKGVLRKDQRGPWICPGKKKAFPKISNCAKKNFQVCPNQKWAKKKSKKSPFDAAPIN